MNFEMIIGNPPYQETNIGNGNGSDPIYHLFIDVAKEFSNKTMFIHPARFLFNAGKTPKEWNTRMLNDSHFKVSNFWIDSSSVFPGVEINGGIVSSMWNKSLAFGKIGFFSAYDEIKTILAKVKLKKDVSFSTIVGPREYYHLTMTFTQRIHKSITGKAKDTNIALVLTFSRFSQNCFLTSSPKTVMIIYSSMAGHKVNAPING